MPGHTRGSVVFVLEERWLFSGDSLAWSHEREDLVAFRGACWYSWAEQTLSLDRLASAHRFSWLLPGHGARRRFDGDEGTPPPAIPGGPHGPGGLTAVPSIVGWSARNVPAS